MARTGAAQGPRSLTVARGVNDEGQELALAGTRHGFDVETIKIIMHTVATACETRAEQELFLARCSAEGLSPLKQEIYAVRRKGRLTFTISYLALIARAAQAGYELALSNAVCVEDDWDGWDAIASCPVKHIIKGGSRGAVIGAYAIWQRRADGERRGWFWSGRDVFPDGNPLSNAHGEHLSMKTAIGRSARLLVPSLMSSIYLAEELGFREGESEAEPVEPGLDGAKDVTPEPEEPRQEAIEPEAVGPAREDTGLVVEERSGTVAAAPKKVSEFLAVASERFKSGDELMEFAAGVLEHEFTTFKGITEWELGLLSDALGEM